MKETRKPNLVHCDVCGKSICSSRKGFGIFPVVCSSKCLEVLDTQQLMIYKAEGRADTFAFVVHGDGDWSFELLEHVTKSVIAGLNERFKESRR